MSKAFIQKPAPPFSGTAVNHYGEFVDIKLSDFKGMRSAFYWKKCALFLLISLTVFLFICRKICGAFLLPAELVSRLKVNELLSVEFTGERIS